MNIKLEILFKASFVPCDMRKNTHNDVKEKLQ